MVGPFMQGMLLMGIIYWYSKGMMSLINDYYRSEFQRKLKAENLKNETIYDIEDIDTLINIDRNLQKSQEEIEETFDVDTMQLDTMNKPENQLEKSTTTGICMKLSNLQLYFNLVGSIFKLEREHFVYMNKQELCYIQ